MGDARGENAIHPGQRKENLCYIISTDAFTSS
jgi:hypothetical protein